MSRPASSTSARLDRMSQMTMQEEIIRKKREILEQKKLVSSHIPGGVVPQEETPEPPSGGSIKNTFNNDGSFLENFKKLTQAANYIEQQQQPPSTEELAWTNGSDIPSTVQELVAMVAAGDGDTVEERLRSRKNELAQQLCTEYKSYRSQVKAFRETSAAAAAAATTDKELIAGKSKNEQASDLGQFVTLHRGYYRDDDDDTEDSDTEYRREAKERNLKNMKNRLVCHYEDSDSSSSDQSEQPKYEGSRFNQDNFPSHSNQERGALSDSGPSGSTKKRKRSRWDDEKPEKTAKVDRSNPELIKLAVNSFGSVDLDEEQWNKVEYQFRIKQVYDEMLAKRQEMDALAKSGRFKYEYDSDEDLNGGTWEHKLRKAEMEATKDWADTATAASNRRHHIGDFLPPDELKKFIEQHDKTKKKNGESSTDYQDKKLTEDNKGFQMLQKLGWKDGEGLGASGSGIVNPINKSAPRESNQGLGVNSACSPEEEDNEYDAYRKRMMLAYRFRPNPLNNPRRAYY